MSALSLLRRTSGVSKVVPGLIIHYQPSGIQRNASGVVTGWCNDVTKLITAARGAPIYTSADLNFNSSPTLTLNKNNTFEGVNVGTTEGLTIVSVDKYVQTTTNGDGCMPWFLGTSSGPLDIWTRNPSNTFRGLNGFSNELYGFAIQDGTQSNPEILTVSIPVTDTTGATFYRNGVFMPITTSASAPGRNLTTTSVYPGYVPISPNYSFEGTKAEFRVYNRLLNAVELTTIHTELKTKFGMP